MNELNLDIFISLKFVEQHPSAKAAWDWVG